MSNKEQAVVQYRYKVSFGAFMTRTPQQWFERDQKKRQKQGWRLVSCNPTARGVLTAIYERDRG